MSPPAGGGEHALGLQQLLVCATPLPLKNNFSLNLKTTQHKCTPNENPGKNHQGGEFSGFSDVGMRFKLANK